jgi:hypothetical protein
LVWVESECLKEKRESALPVIGMKNGGGTWTWGLAYSFGMRHNGREASTMVNLIIEVPDELARSLEGIAAAQHKSIQQLAVERLRSLLEVNDEHRPGTPAAVLRAMHEPPHLSVADVDELDAAIAAGRLAVEANRLFPD